MKKETRSFNQSKCTARNTVLLCPKYLWRNDSALGAALPLSVLAHPRIFATITVEVVIFATGLHETPISAPTALYIQGPSGTHTPKAKIKAIVFDRV